MESMTEESPQTQKRKRGRPRNNGATSNGDQTSEILDTAVKLFAKQGYQATTMSQIAQACGYNQSSLYYWYKKKEELLVAILENSETSLRVSSRIVMLPGEKLVQLYAVLYSDVIMMCDSPFDFYDLENVAHSQDEYLQSFFDTYQQLTDNIEQIVQQGIESGEFAKVDPATIALDALALNEGLQHRYHINKRFTISSNRMVGDDLQPLLRSKEMLAHHSASSTILTLAPDCVPAEVQRKARENNWI